MTFSDKSICSSPDSPFDSCHGTVSIGDEENGVYAACLVDVCHCWIDESCACATMDSYAQTCVDSGVDLSDWREDVTFCRECAGDRKLK